MPRNLCLNCRESIRGRMDKKYCDTRCKNEYHYQQRQNIPQTVRLIDNILHKNRAVMIQVFEGEKKKSFKVPKILLTKLGFDFSYHTGIYKNSRGKMYHYIYDYAWMEFSGQEIMVVKGQKNELDKKK